MKSFLVALVHSIPVDNYSSSIEQQTSLDRPELPGSMEQTSMARSQSAPMLDDELGFPGYGANSQNQATINQKPAIPQKAYHFDHNYNPQVSRLLDVCKHVLVCTHAKYTINVSPSGYAE